MSRSPADVELLLIVTAQCNSRCRYCYQTAKCDRSMGWDTLRSSIDVCLRSRPARATLVFLGGEPLLEIAGIRRAVEYTEARKAARTHVRYEISTNGLLLDDESAGFLERCGFEVQLSFDGVEMAQDFRTPGSFAQLDGLLDRLHDRHPQLFEQNLRVCITLVPDATPWLFDSVRYLVAKDVRRIGISPSLLYHPEWSPDRFAELEGQFASIFGFSRELLLRTGEVPVLCLRKQQGEDESRIAAESMCALADGRRLTVDVDGQVYGCAMLAESYQDVSFGLLRSALPPLRMGHVGDLGLMQRFSSFPAVVSRSELFHHKLRKYSSYGRCADCEHVAACSVCPASIARDPDNTDPHRIPDFVCAFNRTALGYRSRFPAMPHPLGRFGELLEQARRERLAAADAGSAIPSPDSRPT